MSLRKVCWTARCGLALAPPCLQQNGWKGCVARDCWHMSPSLHFRRAHVERRPASGVAPSRNAVAVLHCAFCASSVGDLCMAVQHVPVPRFSALSIMACCSGGIFAACTASAADKILDCCKRHVPSQALRRDTVTRLHRSRADNLRSPFVSRPRACLVHFAGIVLYHGPGVLVNSDPCSLQVRLCCQSCCLLWMRFSERSVQRFADTRHDRLVQVDSRPVRCPVPRRPSEQPLMPRPPKHVGSFARSHANPETSLPRSTESVCPSFQASLQRSHHRRCDQSKVNTLAHEHPRLLEADVVMLTASKSLSALQRRQGSLNPLIRLCGWPKPTCMQCCTFAAEPRRLTPCRLRGTLLQRSRTSVDSYRSSKLFEPRRPNSTCVATESVTSTGQGAFDIFPRMVERFNQPSEHHVVLKANPHEPSRNRARLGEGKA